MSVVEKNNSGALRESARYTINLPGLPYPKMVPRRDLCSTSPDFVAIKNNVDLHDTCCEQFGEIIHSWYARLKTYNIIPLVATQAVAANKT